MSDDLLAKERKFHRLNRELKTHDIMKEINSIVHTSTSTSISNELFNDAKQLHSFTMIDVKTTYPRDKTLNTQDKKSRKSSSLEASEILNIGNIADTENSSKQYNSLGNKAIIELFKSKIDMLHKKLQIIQLDYNKKCEYYKELELKTRKLGETQVKLHSRIGLLSDAIVKLECINYDISSKCQALSNENIVLKKDLHNLKKEIYISHKQTSNCDIKLNRSLENNEKLRSMLKSSQVEEKELRNQIKKLQEDKRLAIRNLEKQQLELVQIVKKQILLIDNLKQQNVYLMTSGQIYLKGEDFAKFLEWKPPTTTQIL